MLYKSCLIFICSLFCFSARALENEIYSQTVYLHKFKNPITQNKLTLTKTLQLVDIYGGFWVDHDRKTNGNEGFTDAQVSPLLGVRSKSVGNEWMYSRIFLEGRFVHRTKSFPDERIRNTYEARGGLLGYGFKEFPSHFFVENYYAAFFSRLYGEKFIVQGWARQGYRFYKHFDLFNEIFADTFDQTRDRDGTLDLRPGARLIWNFSIGSVQLIHQQLYHFANTAFAGRSEGRSTLVFGLYW